MASSNGAIRRPLSVPSNPTAATATARTNTITPSLMPSAQRLFVGAASTATSSASEPSLNPPLRSATQTSSAGTRRTPSVGSTHHVASKSTTASESSSAGLLGVGSSKLSTLRRTPSSGGSKTSEGGAAPHTIKSAEEESAATKSAPMSSEALKIMNEINTFDFGGKLGSLMAMFDDEDADGDDVDVDAASKPSSFPTPPRAQRNAVSSCASGASAQAEDDDNTDNGVGGEKPFTSSPRTARLVASGSVKTNNNRRDDVPATRQRDDVPATRQRDDVPATERHNLDSNIKERRQRDDVPATERHDLDSNIKERRQRDDVPATRQRDDVPATRQRDDVLVPVATERHSTRCGGDDPLPFDDGTRRPNGEISRRVVGESESALNKDRLPEGPLSNLRPANFVGFAKEGSGRHQQAMLSYYDDDAPDVVVMAQKITLLNNYSGKGGPLFESDSGTNAATTAAQGGSGTRAAASVAGYSFHAPRRNRDADGKQLYFLHLQKCIQQSRRGCDE